MTIKEVSEKYNIPADTLRFYERIGMIPPVTRTPGGIRDYQEEDINWVLLAKCMRAAGLPVESMIEYLKLFQQGDGTIAARYQLLTEQREALMAQKKAIDEMTERLDYKISRYKVAMETGSLTWEKEE